MKKTIFFLLFALLLSQRASAAAPQTSAEAMIVYHGPSETVISEKNADRRLPVASTTKIMTALVALERCDTEAVVAIRPEWTGIEGSSMCLKAGEEYTVRELLCGLLLSSGNDAAAALAGYAAGDEETFVTWMNCKAAQLGMESSHFCNPHGLPAEGHLSTARDMARLMAAAMENEDFRAISGTQRCQVGKRMLENHNKLLWQCKGVIAGKTGYTRAAGRCLVSACLRDELELICVTLHAPDDWNDHAAAYAAAFRRYRGWALAEGQELARVPVIGGPLTLAAARAGEGLRLCVPLGSEVTMAADLPRFIFAPVTAGERAGRLRIMVGGSIRGEIPLHWGDDIPQREGKE